MSTAANAALDAVTRLQVLIAALLDGAAQVDLGAVLPEDVTRAWMLNGTVRTSLRFSATL
jgi:hypothetical protein